MSEDEFAESIKIQAKKDFDEGRLGNSKEYEVLLGAFLRAAAPDRKAIYEDSMHRTGGYMNKGHSFFDASGQQVMFYSTTKLLYVATLTGAEKSRIQRFTSMYNAEWNAHNTQLQGRSQNTFATGLDIKV